MLRAGEVVGVYPEATIGRAFVVKDREDFRRGAAYLALATGAPLVPVAHWGIHRIFTVDGRWSLRRGRAVEVAVGAPLVPLPGESAEAVPRDGGPWIVQPLVESVRTRGETSVFVLDGLRLRTECPTAAVALRPYGD